MLKQPVYNSKLPRICHQYECNVLLMFSPELSGVGTESIDFGRLYFSIGLSYSFVTYGIALMYRFLCSFSFLSVVVILFFPTHLQSQICLLPKSDLCYIETSAVTL